MLDGDKLEKDKIQDGMEFLRIDFCRMNRAGKPEAIFAENKTIEEIYQAVVSLTEKNGKALITRISSKHIEMLKELSRRFKVLVNKKGRIAAVFTPEVYKEFSKKSIRFGEVVILAAGTSDISVAEEAAFTAEFLGMKVSKFYDVGVAGLHRIAEPVEHIRNSNVVAVIVVAGMEGALPSVVAGLVDKPVISVPTSVGYGVNFGGIAPLLSMLLSCSSGVATVNIDNGFGAAVFAYLIGRVIYGSLKNF